MQYSRSYNPSSYYSRFRRRRRKNTSNFRKSAPVQKSYGGGRVSSNLVSNLSSAAGRHLIGSARVGRNIGDIARAVVKRNPKKALASLGRLIRGKGDYNVTNADGSHVMGHGVPSFSTGRRYVNVKNTEYLGPFSSATTFTVTSYPINPGMYVTFPWLSQLAINFEEYKFNGLIFYFRFLSADALNSTNTALGKVIMCTEYNSQNANFTSDIQMENHEFAQSNKPACDQIHTIECAKNSNVLSNSYIRSGSLNSTDNILFYDLGNFQIASNGSQAVAVIGELWVSYDVDLIKPQLQGGQQGEAVLSSRYIIPVAGITTSTAYFGSTLPSSTSYVTGSNIAMTFTNTTLTFPSSVESGDYIVGIRYIGSSTVLTNSLVISVTSNLVGLTLFNGVPTWSQVAGVTSTDQFCWKAFNVTGPSAVMTFSSGTMPTSLSSCELYITQFNSNVS